MTVSFDGRRQLLKTLCAAAGILMAAGLASLLAVRKREAEHLGAMGALSCVIGASLISAGLCGIRLQDQRTAFEHQAVSSWSFETLSDCTAGSYGYSCRAKAIGKEGVWACVRLRLSEPLARGTTLSCVGRFEPPSDDEFGRGSWLQGLCGTVRCVRVMHTRPPRQALEVVRQKLLGAICPDRGKMRALVAGCVCGYRCALDESGLTEDFAACGIAHLIAVSGSHLTLVMAVISTLIRSLDMRRGTRLAALALTGAVFVAFCGAPASALRAWAMTVASFGADLAGRRAHALSAACVVGLIMALADPTVTGQLGYELSVSSVVGLCLLSSHATYVLRVLIGRPHVLGRLPASLVRRLDSSIQSAEALLAATCVCQLATLPLVAKAFGRISLLAPLANLLAAPLLSLVLGMGLFCGALVVLPPLLWLVLCAIDALDPLLAVVHALARLPFASVSVHALGPHVALVAPLVMVVWLCWWPQVSRPKIAYATGLVTACALVAVLRFWVFAPARIVILDIGQGDAILVQDGPSAILVDTGPDDAVLTALAHCHVMRLDAVVLTHLHDDHYGGLDDLVGSVSCGEVLVAQGVASKMPDDLREACVSLTGTEPQELSYGDVMHVGDFEAHVIWPCEPVDGSLNAHSIELVVTYARRGRRLSALLTGDAERDETGSCVRAGDVGDIDLLKVGHHGSEVSVDAESAAVLRPELAVASAGEGNAYGHPRPECISILEDAGARFICTKDAGDVDIRPDTHGITVRCTRFKALGIESLS